MSVEHWGEYKDEDALRRIIERLAFAAIDNAEWTYVRRLLLAVWPTRKDISDGVQEVGTLRVGPKEADVDVPEV